MKKSILISGKQGSGKTTRIKSIISNYEKSLIREISLKAFLSISSDKLNPKLIYIIDEVSDMSQVLDINKLIGQHNLKVVSATQLSRNQLLNKSIENFALVFLH